MTIGSIVTAIVLACPGFPHGGSFWFYWGWRVPKLVFSEIYVGVFLLTNVMFSDLGGLRKFT